MPIRHEIAGHVYPSQIALERAIRERLAAHPLNCVFNDDWLAAVLNACHPRLHRGHYATGWFQRLDQDAQQDRRMVTAVTCGGHPVLVACFSPTGAWVDTTAFPWRAAAVRGRHSDLMIVLKGDV